MENETFSEGPLKDWVDRNKSEHIYLDSSGNFVPDPAKKDDEQRDNSGT